MTRVSFTPSRNWPVAGKLGEGRKSRSLMRTARGRGHIVELAVESTSAGVQRLTAKVTADWSAVAIWASRPVATPLRS